MRKGGISSAPSTPGGGSHGRGGQPTPLAEEHHIVATTFVQADVSTFRELVQKLTGGPPSPIPQTSVGGASDATGSICKELYAIPLRRDNILAGRHELEKMASPKPVGGPGPQRTSRAKLLERRQNARKLEVKQLMGPHILKRTISPALSPVSPLTTIDVFAEYGTTSPLGYMGYSSSATPPPAPRPSFDVEHPPPSSRPGLDLNSGVVRVDLERHAASPREPRLLPLFPLHSPGSLGS